MLTSFPPFSLVVITLGGCAITPPPPATVVDEHPAITTLGVAQLHGQTPFMFCEQCPERTPKLISLPPPAAPVVTQTTPEVPTLKRTQRWAVHFSLGSSRIGKQGLDMLNEIVTELKADPSERLLIEGHTDLLGAHRFNKRLAIRRARAVRDALFARGVSRTRMAQLAADCCVEHPPTTNPDARRVDILIKPGGHLYDK